MILMKSCKRRSQQSQTKRKKQSRTKSKDQRCCSKKSISSNESSMSCPNRLTLNSKSKSRRKTLTLYNENQMLIHQSKQINTSRRRSRSNGKRKIETMTFKNQITQKSPNHGDQLTMIINYFFSSSSLFSSGLLIQVQRFGS